MAAGALRQLMRSNVKEADQQKAKLINFASVATGIDSVNSTFSSLLSFTKELTSSFVVQQEAEAKIEQVMRNTLGAWEENIRSIKKFCSIVNFNS